MVEYVASFFNTFMGTPAPAVVYRAITFLITMWLFKAIMFLFGATKTKNWDYVTIIAIAYMFLQTLVGTVSINLGG